MIYTKYMLTPAAKFDDGMLVPKASADDVKEVIEREGEGIPAYAMMGFDPEGERWEVLVDLSSHHGLVRRVRMMFGIELEWDGDIPKEFDRSEGIAAAEYMSYEGRRARAWGGLMAGCCAVYADNEADWLRFEQIAKRLGVSISAE